MKSRELAREETVNWNLDDALLIALPSNRLERYKIHNPYFLN